VTLQLSDKTRKRKVRPMRRILGKKQTSEPRKKKAFRQHLSQKKKRTNSLLDGQSSPSLAQKKGHVFKKGEKHYGLTQVLVRVAAFAVAREGGGMPGGERRVAPRRRGAGLATGGRMKSSEIRVKTNARTPLGKHEFPDEKSRDLERKRERSSGR